MQSRHPSWNKLPAVIRLDVSASVSAMSVREPAFRVIDALQAYPASIQVEAAFAAAVIMARALGADPHELVSRARRQVPDIEVVESAASAISEYVKGELR